MTRMLVATAAILAAVTLGGTADTKVCIKGALIGGVVGQVAGHGVVGATAGCAIGRHNANNQDKLDRQGQHTPAL